MKADFLSYRRAVGVSLMGLMLQGALGLTLLAYGAVVRDHAAISGALVILALVPVWLLLTIVFDQHRRERIEALENESYVEAGAREASAFTEAASDLRVQHARLAWMHRVLLPSVAVVLSLGLAGLGAWRYVQGIEFLSPTRVDAANASLDKFRSSGNVGWPIALGLGLAIVGFVFARYVAGMAKQPVWNNLRAGAAASATTAVLGLALAVGHFVDYLGPDVVLRVLHVAIPVVAGVLGLEFLLSFLLGLYRPRKAGEFPRVAFDSRIMGFVAAPDRIAESIGGALNYQFGFDVSGSWFYQLLTRWVMRLAVLGVAVIWLLTCVAIVQPHQQGMRLRFGARVNEAPLASGAYFKFPWPIERIETFDASSARRVNLGVEPPKLKDRAILWTNDHGVSEMYYLVQPAALDRQTTTDASAANTTGMYLISAEVPLVYTVSDFVKFDNFATPGSREKIISAMGQRELTQLLGQQSVDDALGAGRERIAKELRARVQKRLDEMNSGVQVEFVGVAGAHPPRETASSFEGVVQSTQKRETSVRLAEQEAAATLISVAGDVHTARKIVEAIGVLEAHKHKRAEGVTAEAHSQRTKELEVEVETLVAKAGGSAASMIQSAKADRWSRHLAARSRAEAQEGRVAGYRACPEVYVAKLYFDSLRSILEESRLYIVSDENHLEVRTNLEDPEGAGSIFIKPPDPKAN